MLLAALLLAAWPAAAHLDALTSPLAGATYAPGSVVQVKWGIPIRHNAHDLAYSTDGKTWISIVKGLGAAVFTYSWTVPQLNSSTVRLRVCQLDGGARECTDAHQTQSLDGFAIPGGKLYIAIAGPFTVGPVTSVRPEIKRPEPLSGFVPGRAAFLHFQAGKATWVKASGALAGP